MIYKKIIMVLILVTLYLVHAGLSLDEDPGFRIQVSQKGIDYGKCVISRKLKTFTFFKNYYNHWMKPYYIQTRYSTQMCLILKRSFQLVSTYYSFTLKCAHTVLSVVGLSTRGVCSKHARNLF